ncbi:MAG: glycosyltransferase family 39 protein, partial [Polyangiales bacterium]
MTPAKSPVEARTFLQEPSAKLFALLALALPFVLWLFHHSVGHEGDIRFFYEWYLSFREGAAFYRDGPGINYPILGVLFVCGPARLVEAFASEAGALDFDTFRTVLKASLVLWEVALIPVVAGLARALGSKRPRLLALFLYLLPSTWATGALFGQIDIAGTTFLVAAAWALLRFRESGSPRAFIVAVLSLTAALLTKQLTWFCAPALVALALVALWQWQNPKLWALALLSPLLLIVADPFLQLPAGYSGHLHFILAGGGSSHGDLVVASGASIWSVFYSGGTLSEDVRFVGVGSFAWGWILWGVTQLCVLWRVKRASFSTRAFVWWAGMSQLAMCTLMTGVHERYFVHAIPFLVLVSALRTRLGAALVFVAVACGVYVVATIVPALQWTVLGRAQPVAVL